MYPVSCILCFILILISDIGRRALPLSLFSLYYICICMYVKIWRHQHTRVHAHTGPWRHARGLGLTRGELRRVTRGNLKGDIYMRLRIILRYHWGNELILRGLSRGELRRVTRGNDDDDFIPRNPPP